MKCKFLGKIFWQDEESNPGPVLEYFYSQVLCY